MTRHRGRAGAVLVRIGLAATATGCAPASSPAPSTTVPATLPTTPTSPATVRPTPTASAFTPTPVPTGRTGTLQGGLPPTSTRTSPDPDVVAAAGITAYSRADTHRRALPWTTGELAAGIREDRPVTAPGATWAELAALHGYAAVTVTYDHGAPTDIRKTAYRQFVVAAVPHGRDRWTGRPLVETDFLVLTRTFQRLADH